MLLSSLSINSFDSNPLEKVELQISESLISIISILEIFLSPNKSSSTINNLSHSNVIDFSSIFLSSRLLPVLSSLLMKFISSTDPKPLYLKLNEVTRRRSVSITL